MPFSGSKCYTCLPCSLVGSCCDDFVQKKKKKRKKYHWKQRQLRLSWQIKANPVFHKNADVTNTTEHNTKTQKQQLEMGDVYCIYYLLPWMQKLMTVCRSHETIIHLIIWSFLLDGFMAMKLEWNTGHVNSGSIMTVLFGFCFRII